MQLGKIGVLQNARAEIALGVLRRLGSILLGGSVRRASAVRVVGAVAFRRLAGRGHLRHDLRVALDIVLGVVIVITAHVAGLLRTHSLFLERLDDRALDILAASGIDRMRNVRVQLGSAIGIANRAVLVEARAALIAMTRPQVILAAAAG